ncbi:hypothetical protein BpHYR1_002229 [Brachionus plicatilis]|uniref:Uncharacterized protein n=1 Tax=Brachionus plicatilis TaxID=10195 RepID=A0A3M7SEG2_BRAPC|nr:hypothetical protein BpHYR1_002229 [Brachionus plicatilis]
MDMLRVEKFKIIPCYILFLSFLHEKNYSRISVQFVFEIQITSILRFWTKFNLFVIHVQGFLRMNYGKSVFYFIQLNNARINIY